MAGTIVVDRIESDASYTSSINVANRITFSNTVNFGVFAGTAPVAGFYLPTTNNLVFTTASTERVRIDSAGNMGIGTASPGAKLDVRGSSTFLINSSNPTAWISSDSGLSTQSMYMQVNTTSSDTRLGSYTSHPLVFLTSNTERMRIRTDGQVGIGTTVTLGNATLNVNQGVVARTAAASAITPYYQLYNGNASTDLKTWRIAGNTDGSMGFETVNDVYNSAQERMRITSAGFVGIGGATSPSAGEKLTVNSTGQYVCWMNQSTNTSGFHVLRLGLNPNNNNTSSYFLHGNTNTVGNWFLYGNGTMSFSSDQRLKKNIETTRDGYVEDLCRLRVVKYNWRNDDNSTPKELGLIAQEVAEVFPNLVLDDQVGVSEDDSTHYKSLKYSVLPFMLLKAIQEQQALITTLTARITALESN
jgi:hypothetical protein